NADAKVPLEDKPLLSAAVCYGSGMQELQGPTDDVAALKKAVEGIQNDPSGEERTFSAVMGAGQKYLNFKTEQRRNVMIVVVTDEVGSDSNTPQLVDQSIGFARRYQLPVYVLGVPAPFGRKEVPFRFVNDDPAFEETEYMIPVEQGPESRAPEAVALAFWGDNPEEGALIDSGFGCYQLTRLCYETGGLYFAIHPNRNRAARARGGRMETPANSTVLYHFWDPAVMLPYTPQYMTDAEYQKFVFANKARAALVSTSTLASTGVMENPATKFPKFDEGTLATALSEAQRQAAKLAPKLDVLYESIKVGAVDRPKLEEPRWQAGFDLAMGRIMASVVRTKGYNLMLAEAKSGKPFKDPKNNTWELSHSDKVTTSSSLAKMAEDATTMLKRVVEEHPGTPWAFLAAKELETPMGWEWTETYTAPPAPQMDGNGAAAAAAQAAMMKRKPNAPRPKL
ncbi:MAG TPA: vWA domain-containing protein, partial [Pirellulales bacterium]